MTIHIDTDHLILPFYQIFILSSLIAGMIVLFRLCSKRGIPTKKNLLLLALIPTSSWSCAFLYTFIRSGGKNLGLSSVGAAIGVYLAAIATSLLIPRIGDRNVLLQNCTFAMPLMYSIAKLGCLFAGCCHGVEYDGIFHIEYYGEKNGNICVFPVQLLESAVFLAIFISGMIMLKKRNKYSVKIVLIVSVCAKFSLSFLRA